MAAATAVPARSIMLSYETPAAFACASSARICAIVVIFGIRGILAVVVCGAPANIKRPLCKWPLLLPAQTQTPSALIDVGLALFTLPV